MHSKSILLIEDDIELQTLIKNYLYEYNYNCIAFSSPKEVLKEFTKNNYQYSLIILDLGLPEMDGFDLFKRLKNIASIPIIISTARGDIGNKIHGFELGADDYLAKPYEPRELVLRIKLILQRYTKNNDIRISDFIINRDNFQVLCKNENIEFTKIEFNIFIFLIDNANKIVSREEILNNTKLKSDTKNRTIDMHISNIRFKLNDDSQDAKYIKSVWGIGYKFIV